MVNLHVTSIAGKHWTCDSANYPARPSRAQRFSCAMCSMPLDCCSKFASDRKHLRQKSSARLNFCYFMQSKKVELLARLFTSGVLLDKLPLACDAGYKNQKTDSHSLTASSQFRCEQRCSVCLHIAPARGFGD